MVNQFAERRSVCRVLLDQWAALVQDWLILSSESPQIQAGYSPRLFAAPTAAVLASIRPFLDQAWASSLAAVCALLAAGKEVCIAAPFLHSYSSSACHCSCIPETAYMRDSCVT